MVGQWGPQMASCYNIGFLLSFPQLIYMMVTLVVIYIITVTPGRIMDALKSYYIIGDSGIFYIKKVKGTIDMVRGINSWTNVVVYTLISR